MSHDHLLRDASCCASCCAPHACRNWQIVATGHSLGAGASALVALYIRSFYPRSRAWAFEPPGGLVDGQLARASADCVTSVVLGKDWVPRLSVASFERLRDEMVRDSLTPRRCADWAALTCKFANRAVLGKDWGLACPQPVLVHLRLVAVRISLNPRCPQRYDAAWPAYCGALAARCALCLG